MSKRRCKPMTLTAAHHHLLRQCFVGHDEDGPDEKAERHYLSAELTTEGALPVDEPDELIEVLLVMSREEWRQLNARLCKNKRLDVTICGATR